jgi:uncharacterized protein with GYD domain
VATYVGLFTWTEKGIAAFKDSPARADQAAQELAGLGVTLREIYWTLGPYDLVAVFDAPDDESMTAAMLRLGAKGNVRSTTLRAFARQEFEAIAARA